jgi:hypothetical protein
MATFYVLPPRENLELIVGGVFQRLLPGLSLPSNCWEAVIERISELARWPTDVYLVPRDDIPEELPINEVLRTAYGAEPDDRIVDVRLTSSSLELHL